MVLLQSFDFAFMVLSYSFQDSFFSLLWQIHSPFMVLSQSLHSPFHSPFLVLSRFFRGPSMAFSCSFNSPQTVISWPFTVLMLNRSLGPLPTPLKQNLYLGDPPCPEVGPGASMSFIYISYPYTQWAFGSRPLNIIPTPIHSMSAYCPLFISIQVYDNVPLCAVLLVLEYTSKHSFCPMDNILHYTVDDFCQFRIKNPQLYEGQYHLCITEWQKNKSIVGVLLTTQHVSVRT